MQKRHPTTGVAEGEEEGDDIQAGARDGKGALDKYSGVKVGDGGVGRGCTSAADVLSAKSVVVCRVGSGDGGGGGIIPTLE